MAIGLNWWQSGGSDPPFFMPVHRSPRRPNPEPEPSDIQATEDTTEDATRDTTETSGTVPDEYKMAQTADPMADQPYARFTNL